MTEWFEDWFGEEYLDLYPHRDEAEAIRAVTLLRESIPWRPGLRVLDVGCGAGRHTAALEQAGARVTGLDLSRCLLDHARELTAAPLIRADMRTLPVRPGTMDLAVNLFTSFGYFASDAEHARTLDGMAATLRPGGWFAIDFLHAMTVVDALVPEQDLVLGTTRAHVSKRLTEHPRHVIKTITLQDGRNFTERVRLFTPLELEQMLTHAGLAVRCRFGGYDGAPLQPGSPRAILIAERAA